MKTQTLALTLLFLCSIFTGFGQIFENFDGLTEDSYDSYNYNGFQITNGLCNSTNSVSGNAVRLRNAASSLEYIGVDGNGKDGGGGIISFWYRSWDGSPTAIYNVEASINGGIYTIIGTQISTVSTSYSLWSSTLDNANDNIKIRISWVSGERLHIDNFSISNYTLTSPTITVTPTSLTGLDYIFNSGPSAQQTFIASGTDLADNITLTAPTNFEISTTSGSSFSGSVTLPQSGGTVASTTIYVRLKAGLAVNPYTGNITAVSSGATTQNVAVSGDVTAIVGGSCSELFFSEYIEGSSNNKYIEIYNPTSSSIDLTNYQLVQYNNGSSSPSYTLPLINSIGAYGTYVIANSSAAIYGGVIDLSDNSVMTFNGNDAIALQTSGGTNIDVIGQIGVDPGSEWSGTTCSTLNTSLIRKNTIQSGDSNGSDSFNPDTEWTFAATDDVSNLGSHTSDCYSTCTPTHTITSFTPTLGPVDTEVTIIGTGFTVGSTVDFNGTSATILSQTATTLVVEVPAGATTGVITVAEASCGLESTLNFTILNDNGCVGGTMPAGFSDLMFSGIYDDETDSCHYIELLNPTTSDIDLADYTLIFDNNFTLGSVVPTTGFNTITLSGTILAESTYMLQVTDTPGGCISCPTISPDFVSIGSLGLNDEDRLVLVKDFGLGTAAAQDVWQNHSNGVGYDKGYVFARDFSSTAPSTTFSLAEWVYDGNENCFGFALSSAVLPTVNTQPVDTSGCYSAAFIIAATAGGGGTLTYQWKYNDGSASEWTNVLSTSFSPGSVIGETAINLTISGYDLDGYQFYCEVTENGSCAVSSNAAQVITQSTTWNGSTWSTTPTISTTTILNGNYNTAVNGSFSACSLIVEPTFNLTVSNSTYVEVENDVVVNGTLVVETKGSFVQNNDNGLFTVNSGGTASVNKTTAPLNNWYEYTYWSSPVIGETIGVALALSPVSRRFWFNAQNFLDSTAETGNDNATITGQDGIDDNGDDWQYAVSSDVMLPGVGYAATQSSSVLTQYDYTFTGPFNNGVITVPVYRNDGELLDENSNFIGNPYASAVDVDVFFNTNSNTINPSGVLGGAIYLWSQNTAPSSVTNGNEDQNFAQSDYAIINASEVAGGDGIIPDRYIPSGQGFFTSFSDAASANVVSGTIMTRDVIFNNSMRAITGNDQFFKSSNKSKSNSLTNKIWINLTSDNGVFNQLNIAYVSGATNAYDGTYYDAKKTVPKGMGAIIYSLIEGSEDKFVIQGKDVKSLSLKEIIYLGLNTSINVPTQYKLSIPKIEGDFVTNQPIYLKDNKFNLYHNLSNSDYSFTAEPGEYNNRFEISFRDGSQPINNLNPNELVIFELNDGNVQFTINDDLTIKNITIIDILGRNIYNLKGSNYTETYNLSRLGISVYIAKVELSNGEIIIKKAIKKL